MKKIFAFITAAVAASAILPAVAVTTNRVTVTEFSGSSTVQGSLGWWIKNAPINGDVLELTLIDPSIDDGARRYHIDEPMTILNGQKIIIRCEPLLDGGPYHATVGGQGKQGPVIYFVSGSEEHDCPPPDEPLFTIQENGYLRMDRVSYGMQGPYLDADSAYGFTKPIFENYGTLELYHCSLGHKMEHAYVEGAILRLYEGSSTICEGCTLQTGGLVTKCLESESDDAWETADRSPESSEGGIVYATGGRFTMVNSTSSDEYSKHSFYFRGTNVESLFVNCSLGTGIFGDFGGSIFYDDVAEGKHQVVGCRLGFNSHFEKVDGKWTVDSSATCYQVQCVGSGRPVVRASVIETDRATKYGRVVASDGSCEFVNCVTPEWTDDAITARTILNGLIAPYLEGGVSIFAATVFTPYPRMNIMNQGAWVWHDEKWENVAGEDTERFAIRGSAALATEPLGEDIIGKPMSTKHRPTASHLQWDEPTLVVSSGFNVELMAPNLRSYRFVPDVLQGDDPSERLGSMSLISGLPTLQDVAEYAAEDWRGERRLVGPDGWYHVTFAEGVRGGTVEIAGEIPIRKGVKMVIEGGGTTIDARGLSRIFHVMGGELVLRDLTLKGGLVDGETSPSVILPPDATCRGGAVFVESADNAGGSLTMENCRVEDCVATEAGGAIHAGDEGCSVTVRDSSFVRCSLIDAASGKGGAISVGGDANMGFARNLTLENVVFAECGGSAANNDVVLVGKRTDAVMSGVVMSGGDHGGLYIDVDAGSVALSDSVLAGNAGWDISGMPVKIAATNVTYATCSGMIYGEGNVQVGNVESVIVPGGYHDTKVNGVAQARYWLKDDAGLTDLGAVTGATTVTDGATLVGTLAEGRKISIAAGATVTLWDVSVNSAGNNDAECPWAGISCLGDATIVLRGTNVVRGFHEEHPGIHVPKNCTLTICGDGSLAASGCEEGYGVAGIGGGYAIDCGTIVIEGGTISATGSYESAPGIGAGIGATCDGVSILGGDVTADGGMFAPGIGGVGGSYCGSCASVVIGPGVTRVTATCGDECDDPIGAASDGVVTVAETLIDTTEGATRTLEQWDGDLAAVKGPVMALDGTVIRGKLAGSHKVSIAAGARVTLRRAVIEGTDSTDFRWAGLTCEGDATIVLESDSKVRGFHGDYPGIFVPVGSTLTIRGGGTLAASSNGGGAGIGGGRGIACGAVAIEGGSVTAVGGASAAGIGGGSGAACGAISVGAGIVRVSATCGGGGANPIGAGAGGSGGAVTLADGMCDATEGATRVVKPWDGNLTGLAGNVTAVDGIVISGSLAGNCRVSIADGATVTLRNAEIAGGNDENCPWAGITCLGDATIVLEGENGVRGFYEEHPGVYVPAGSALTIRGDGSLDASSNGYGAGIGGGYQIACGDIAIEGGTVSAEGGTSAAGIGGGYSAACGAVTIGSGIVKVDSTCGTGCDNPIGAGTRGTGGEVTIGEGVRATTSGSTCSVRKLIDLSKGWTELVEVPDTAVVTGESVFRRRVTIPAGATVTLSDVVITNGLNAESYSFAGITCLGDATIVLEGKNIVRGFYEDYPGISVPVGCTLTIRGDGSLDASSNGYGAGIGGGYQIACGDIVIEGGSVSAHGGGSAAGIGGGFSAACGAISIGAGITRVVAECGKECNNPIGCGTGGSGGDVTVAWSLSDTTEGKVRTIERVLDLTAVNGETEIEDGVIAKGELAGNYKVTIADGATVTLKDVIINASGASSGSTYWAGITCEGDATIILEGENTVKSFNEYFAGIFVPAGKTLTIKGEGKLTAVGGRMGGAGIGAGSGTGAVRSCGNIVVDGGEISATGGAFGGAGIGGGLSSACGDISVEFGTVRIVATGGAGAKPIGAGNCGDCGDVTVVRGLYSRTADNTRTISHEAPPDGFGAWAAYMGLSGDDAEWDAKPAMWGGSWANAFVYTYGEGLADGSVVLMTISFDANGKPVITTAPVVEGHEDFTAEVVGSESVGDWASPVTLQQSGNNWTLPAGESANFFRVRLEE